VAKLTANGYGVDLGAASGPNGWSVSNLGKAAAVSLTGSTANDTLVGGTLNDTLTGGGGNDLMIGGAGADRFIIDAGTDTVRDLGVGDALQVLAGASVQATLTAAWSADATSGNDGIARLYAAGFSVDLSLAGGALGWNVTNNGQAVAVSLLGSAAGDTLIGGTAGDTLVGGLGTDRLTGGAGADVFRFLSLADSAAGTGRDGITDFKAAEGDILDLAAIDANSLVGGDQAFAWIGGAAFSHGAGQLRLARGRLQGDVDGDAVADFELTLSGVAMLEVGAIWL
jgi:Ca2+-binding RTX toxin-like protein